MKNKIQPIKLYFATALHVFSKASEGMRLEKRNRSPTIIPKNEVGTPAMLAAFEYVAASQLKKLEILQRLLACPNWVG